MKTIGILGGMGPLATVELYKKIILKTKAEKDQEHIHVIIDSNTNIPDRTDNILNDGENPLVEMIKSARVLEEAGADFLIMPCNTAHYFYNELCEKVNIPFLNMLEITVNYIEEKYRKDITAGLLATDGTILSGIYDKYFNNSDLKLIKPKLNQHYVMEFIYEGIKKGNYEIGTSNFFKARDELLANGAELLILGCTELPIGAEIFQFKGNYLDPMDVLAEKAIKFAGGEIKKTW